MALNSNGVPGNLARMNGDDSGALYYVMCLMTCSKTGNAACVMRQSYEGWGEPYWIRGKGRSECWTVVNDDVTEAVFALSCLSSKPVPSDLA